MNTAEDLKKSNSLHVIIKFLITSTIFLIQARGKAIKAIGYHGLVILRFAMNDRISPQIYIFLS